MNSILGYRREFPLLRKSHTATVSRDARRRPHNRAQYTPLCCGFTRDARLKPRGPGETRVPWRGTLVVAGSTYGVRGFSTAFSAGL
jgi:hypothetical protein